MSVKAANYTEKFGFGRKMIWSALIMIILLVSTFAVYVYAGYETNRIETEKRPKLNLSGLVASLRKYHTSHGTFPSGLNELRASMKKTAAKNQNSNSNAVAANNSPAPQKSPDSSLYDDKFFVENNFLYVYYSDKQFCSVWAIPQGEYADEAQTVFVLVMPTSEEKWRGPRINSEDFRFLPQSAIPTKGEMARLGMSKQEKTKQEKSFFDGLIPF